MKFDKKRCKVKLCCINGFYFGLEGGVCHIFFSWHNSRFVKKTVGQVMQTKYFLDGCFTHFACFINIYIYIYIIYIYVYIYIYILYIYIFWNILYKGLSLVRGNGASPTLFSRETIKIPLTAKTKIILTNKKINKGGTSSIKNQS